VINRIFYGVAKLLLFIGKKTGLTYNEVNIITYYFLIPLSWCLMLDVILEMHYLTIGWGIFVLGFLAGCRDFKAYADWLFVKSVDFLNLFNKIGSSYNATSVWICVTLPLVVYGILIYLMF
jgi:hypothetical protein